MNNFVIMKHIEIDAAHRVPEHGSGCRNIHGHRYKIEAHCIGTIADVGEQSGMTLDFKFLKEEMMKHIHDPCDHGMILRADDNLLDLVAPDIASEARTTIFSCGRPHHADNTYWNRGLKLYLIGVVPTAENLAKHWYERLKQPVVDRSEGRASLLKIRVWETPTCYADYPG